MRCLSCQDDADLSCAAAVEASSSQQPSFGLLRQAWLCLELSDRIYAATPGSSLHPDSVDFPASHQQLPVKDLPRRAKVTLLDCSVASSKDNPAEATTWGLWHVENIGFVVAIRGSVNPLDWLSNLEFTGWGLTGILEQEGLELHWGIFARALGAADAIVCALNKHAERAQGEGCRLLFTGARLVFCSSKC